MLDKPLMDLSKHVGDDKKFVDRSGAVRASTQRTFDILDETSDRYNRPVEDK